MRRVLKILSVAMCILLIILICPAAAETDVMRQYKVEGVTDVALTQDAELLLIAAKDAIYAYNIDGTLKWDCDVDSAIKDLSASRDGSKIITYSGSDIYIIDKNGRKIGTPIGTGNEIGGIGMSSDGKYIAAGSGGNIMLFESNGRRVWMSESGRRIADASVSNNGVVTAGAQDHVMMMDYNGSLVTDQSTTGNVNSVATAASSDFAAAGTDRGHLYMFDRNGTLLWSKNLRSPISSVSISTNGAYILVGLENYKIYCLNKGSGTEWEYDAPGIVKSVAISPNGDYAALASLDGTVELINAATRRESEKGSISVNCTPAGANVYMNDVLKEGTTPLILTSVKKGSHSIKCTLGGYENATENVTVEAGSMSTVELVMIQSASENAGSSTGAPSETATPVERRTVPKGKTPGFEGVVALSCIVLVGFHLLRRSGHL